MLRSATELRGVATSVRQSIEARGRAARRQPHAHADQRGVGAAHERRDVQRFRIA
jgi:hypothetical protein